MSLPRATSSATSAMFRFAAAVPPSARNCPRCMRPSSSQMLTRSSRRSLQTATAYRPHTLTPMPPPRNSGIPETSIAGTSRLDQPRQKSPAQSEQRTELPQQKVAVPEKEAQKSSQAHASPSTAPAPAPASPSAAPKPRRSKLRPRKAAINLSPTAVSQLRALLDQPEPKLIRVGVRNRGCSGLAYHLEYVDKPGPFDETVEQDGVKVLIDSKALFSIIGSEMDWLQDKLNERFIFKNPNITEQCGCGESFSIS